MKESRGSRRRRRGQLEELEREKRGVTKKGQKED